jgi:hypothetical protein
LAKAWNHRKATKTGLSNVLGPSYCGEGFEENIKICFPPIDKENHAMSLNKSKTFKRMLGLNGWEQEEI